MFLILEAEAVAALKHTQILANCNDDVIGR